MEAQGASVPRWTDEEVRALLLLQAARFMGLANLLEQKGLVTRQEIAEAVGSVFTEEMPRLLANVTFTPGDAPSPEMAAGRRSGR
jgi:hypothetical protein